MTYLLIGRDSEIARATRVALDAAGLPAIATTRRGGLAAAGRLFLDLAPPLGDWQPPPGIETACVFAAFGHLVDCARDPAGSTLVNVTRTVELVERLADRGVYPLWLSTDKVFDGSRARMPATAPLTAVSVYGKQKARTDAHLQAMIAAGAPVGILRLARVLSPGMALFRQWRDALAAGRKVTPFQDMMMAPTLAADVTAAILPLLQAREPGVWQLSGPRDVSYAEIAAFIARRIGADPALVEPVAAASAGMPAGATPRHTTLDSGALARFGIAPRDPWEVIEAVL